jgi:hypothetical protein
MQNEPEMSRDREMLFELADGRPFPRLSGNGLEVDGVKILTPAQVAERLGGTAERWRMEWLSSFGSYLEVEPARVPTPQEALLNIANRVRVLVDELEGAVELLHGSDAQSSLDEAASDMRQALMQIMTSVIEEPPCDGGSGELATAIRHARGQRPASIDEVRKRIQKIEARGDKSRRQRKPSAPTKRKPGRRAV